MSRTEKLLHAILSATENKTLTWRQLAPDEFESTGPFSVRIKQITPLIAGDSETSGPQAFQIEVDRICISCWDGTTASDLVREILSKGLKNWRIHNKLIAENIDVVVKKLKQKTGQLKAGRKRGKGISAG